MGDAIKPFVFATLVWWLSTGLILLMDRRAVSVRISLFLTGFLALGSLYCLSHISLIDSPRAAYAGFFCAILVWAWVEVSFLTGWVTGPSKEALADGATETERLTSAITAVLYHELMILAAGGLITWVSWGQPNKVALWTFLVLWIMRCSAKLNLFLGVRNIGTEFLPDRMGYLGSFFRVRKMNWLFPFSVVGSIAAIVYLVMVALQSNNSSATSTGLFLVVALLGLALLEHWFMVLPVQPSALWKWAMNRKNSRNESEHTGFEKTAIPIKTPREIL